VSAARPLEGARSIRNPIGRENVRDVEWLTDELAAGGYLADRGLATVISIAMTIGKPLLLEGEPGVGKTQAARSLAEVLGARLIRLQCYEGIDVATALYDWDYTRQMLYIRTLEAAGAADESKIADLFGPDFLIRRPLLEALEVDDAVPPVLLIDEIDRADDEFEAFLLELLSDFQVTIPEVGTISARRRPVVVLTSNRTRELHDALKRRCLYHWIGHPSLEREIAIVRSRVPEAPERLAREAAMLISRLRQDSLVKSPGIAETIDWVEALAALGERELEPETVSATLGVLLKHREDIDQIVEAGVEDIVGAVRVADEEGSADGG
jgi:MoxR-like ATPase